MKRTAWAIIGRGLNGWHASARSVPNETGTGSTKASASGGDLWAYVSDAEDGALLYDASASDVDAFAQLVIAGPMVDPDLPAGTISPPFGESPVPYVPGAETGLSSVAVDVYREMLRRVPGVRIGKVERRLVPGVAIATGITWEDSL